MWRAVTFVLSIKELGNSWAGREQAEQEIADYVFECWDDEMDIDKPEDTEEMVDAYFDHVLEEYRILELNS